CKYGFSVEGPELAMTIVRSPKCVGYAKETMFKGRIVHGMFSAGLISAVLGTKLPGPGAVYVNQILKFKAPVHIGDTVTARVEVLSKVPEKKFVTMRTSCSVGGRLVVDGEATLMVPSREQ
ncbi:MAG: MaoC family dehydratase, partial [Rectinemataceae bacterium]